MGADLPAHVCGVKLVLDGRVAKVLSKLVLSLAIDLVSLNHDINQAREDK